MIKKNTKIIFEEGASKTEEELIGGIPLSKGEIIKVHKNNKIVEYKVKEKNVDAYLDGEDQIINIVYLIKKLK